MIDVEDLAPQPGHIETELAIAADEIAEISEPSFTNIIAMSGEEII